MNFASIFLALSAAVVWLLVEYSGMRHARLERISTDTKPFQGPSQVS